MSQAAFRKSDLGVRALSAVVMIAVAGTALWLGGWWWVAFILLIAAGVYWEWVSLVRRFATTHPIKFMWLVVGAIYIAFSCFALEWLRSRFGFIGPIYVIGAVAGSDIGAYFFGRTIGGPKIAPAISPSKTWAGLFGGIVGAALAFVAIFLIEEAVYPTGYMTDWTGSSVQFLIFGLVIALVSQIGDFFESWMKRRAGVKDSGALIPGHGGLFDRVDGLLAVLLFVAVLPWDAIFPDTGIP